MANLAEKIKASIERLKAFCPEEGYYLAFSGGKDSVVVKRLAEMAGVKFDAHYNVTSVDPPELVRFIIDKHPDVSRDIPRYSDGKAITMWNLIPKKLMPPTRLVRYCCSELKERGGYGRMTVTGVRWAESVNRSRNQGVVTIMDKTTGLENDSNFHPTSKGGVVLANDNDEARRTIEHCYKLRSTVVNPIIDWDDRNVWEFIKSEGIPYCGLYDDGFTRLGCIGCPMGSRQNRAEEFRRWPKYREAYLRAFDRMIVVRKERGKPCSWDSAEECFAWWTRDPNLQGQLSLDDVEQEG